MNKNKSILFLDQYSKIGGAQKILISLIRVAINNGMLVSVMIPAKNELGKLIREMYPSINIINIQELSLNQGRKRISDIIKLFDHSFWFVKRNLKIVRSHDIVYVNGPRLVFHLLWISIFSKLKLFIHIHLEHRGIDILLIKLAALNKKTSKIIFPSNYIKNYFINNSRIFKSPKIYVLNNGLSLEYKFNFEDRFSNDFINSIVIIGRLSIEKGQNAIKETAENNPNIKFHLLGDSDHSSEDYKEYLQQIMPSNVYFHGKVFDIPKLIRQIRAQICIVPSRCNEAFGLSAIEGMALSCFTLVRDKGGLKEIASKTNAYIFNEDEEIDTIFKQLKKMDCRKIINKTYDQYIRTMNYYSYEMFINRINKLFNIIN